MAKLEIFMSILRRILRGPGTSLAHVYVIHPPKRVTNDQYTSTTKNMEKQPNPPVMLTKKEFEKRLGFNVSFDTWNTISLMLQHPASNDEGEEGAIWKACVGMAKMAKKLEEEKEKKASMAKKLEEAEKQITALKGAGLHGKSAPYLVLSASEVAKDPKLRSKFREFNVAEDPCRGGFIAQKFYLDFVWASREIEHCLKGKEEIVGKVAHLGRILSVRADHSLFNNSYLDEEAPQSAVAAELFRLAIDLLRPDRDQEPVPMLKVTHQQHLVGDITSIDCKILRANKRKWGTDGSSEEKTADKKKSLDEIDICVWFIHPEESLGACVMAACEYKSSNLGEALRKAQADIYGSNILLLHQKQCIVIDIAGGNKLENWTVSAYGLVKAEFSTKQHFWEKSLLYSGYGAEAIVMVTYGLIEAQKSFPNKLEEYGHRLGPVVGVIDENGEEFVYKVYDGATIRKPNLDVIQKLLDPGAKLLRSKDGKLEILKMKLMKSNWKETVNARVFVEIIAKLKRLHREFHSPHGDIRLANLLSCGSIIDFDFVGAEVYPSTLNPISQDGKRHPDVEEMIEKVNKGEAPSLQPSYVHDWYSLAEVMRLFRPTNGSDSEWKTCCEKVRHGFDESDAIPDCFVELENDIPLQGTGHTPVRKQPRSQSTESIPE